MTILMLVGLNLLFLVIAAIVAMFIYDGYDNFVMAFIDVTSFLIVPASVANVDDSALTVLGMVVIVVGMLLFTGTIIALATNLLRNYLTSIGRARGKLNISDHIVILRYNNEVPSILADLMESDENHTVLLLSDKSKEEVRADLLARLADMDDEPAGKIRLIVREGDPSSMNELEEIALENARGLLIMNDRRSNDDKFCEADFIGVLKLVLKVSEFEFNGETPIGVETTSQRASDIMREMNIEGLRDKQIQFFSHNRKLGQFLAIAVICPELYAVLMHLLASKGCEFYPIEPMPRDEYLAGYGHGLPTINFEDRMFVLSETRNATMRKRGKQYRTDRVLPVTDLPKNIPNKLFIIGENKKSQYMMDALRTDCAGMEINHYRADDMETFVADLLARGDDKSVAVVLSDDGVTPDRYDANVFMTLIELSRVCGINERPFRVVAEILDPNNNTSLEKFKVESIIVSTEIISLFAAKLLKDIRAERFYEEILSYQSNHMNIRIATAAQIFGITEPQKFSCAAELVCAAYNGGGGKFMPLGWMATEGPEFFCCEALDVRDAFDLDPTDQIIYCTMAGE